MQKFQHLYNTVLFVKKEKKQRLLLDYQTNIINTIAPSGLLTVTFNR
jgi:hypothetical protein